MSNKLIHVEPTHQFSTYYQLNIYYLVNEQSLFDLCSFIFYKFIQKLHILFVLLGKPANPLFL